MNPVALPPEIQLMVAQHLQHQDLCSISLLNKEWHSTCNPQLYHAVRLTTTVQHRRFLALFSSDNIRRHASHIKFLLTRYIDVLPLIMRTTADNKNINNSNSGGSNGPGEISLVGLEILCHRSLNFLTSQEDDYLLSFLKRNPQLLHLTIRRMSENTWTYFSTIAYSLPRLRTLNIFDIVGLGTPIIVKRSAIRFLNTCSPDLERLVLAWGIISFSEALSDVSYNGNVKDHSTHLALKFLSVRGNAESSLAPFILRCPMLKAVINPGFQATCSTTLLHRDSPLHLALQETTGIRFMELHVPLTNTDDHAIGDLISNISRSPDGVQQRWRTIAINGEIKEGTDEITRAIVDNCREGLVHLSIPKAWQLKSRDLHSILCSLTDLRVFSVIHIPKMDVSDVISSPWVCRWLTRLSVQITNIPRPDILVDRKGYIKLASERKADGSVEESRAIQRKVYRQLGALTCLEFLDLGTDAEYGSREQLVDDIYGTIYDPQFQMNCLEMSLASGLDLLSDLQNLRSLRLVGMEHRIGIPELQWMLSHFIRLERLSGVDPEVAYLPLYLRPTRKYQPEPGVQQWLSKHVATWVLLE